MITKKTLITGYFLLIDGLPTLSPVGKLFYLPTSLLFISKKSKL